MTTRISRLDTEDLLTHLQEDCELSHTLQIDREDLMDERPIYCIWTVKFCRNPQDVEIAETAETMASNGEFRLHLDVMEPDDFDTWAVASYWEQDAFPYGNCPLQYLAICERVIDLDWRLEVLQNHRDLADTLESSYLPGSVQ